MTMSRRPVPLPNMRGGINRRDVDARPDQCFEALDVIADRGPLRRRPGFRSIAAVPPHLRMNLATRVVTETSLGVFANLTDRAGSISGFRNLYVGWSPISGQAQSDFVDTMFNAIEWRHMTLAGATLAFSRQIALDYWNGAAWTQLPYWHDSTIYVQGNYIASLAAPGQLSWHTPDDWALTSVNSISGQWIRIRSLDFTGAGANFDNITLNAPGAQVGDMQPVRGLYPVTLGRAQVVVAAHDRTERIGVEAGGALSIWDGATARRMQRLNLSHAEGAGFYHRMAWPGWAGGASAGNIGTDGYLWSVTAGVDPSSGVAQATYWQERVLTSASTPLINGANVQAGATVNNLAWDTTDVPSTKFQGSALQGCLIACITNPSGSGTPANEIRRIHSSGATAGSERASVYPAWSIAPDNQNTFTVWPAHSVLRTLQSGDVDLGTFFSNQLGLALSTLSPYSGMAPDFPLPTNYTLQAGQPVHYSVELPLKWRVAAQDRWDAAYDPITKRLLLSSGGGLLTFDGTRLRPLAADTTSTLAGVLTATLPDEPGVSSNRDPNPIRQAKLRSAPAAGKYIADFNGRMLTAGFDDRPNDVAYTYYGGGINIWPKVYRATIRDHLNRPITGITSLYDRCVAFTEASIHEGRIDTEGFLQFVPAAQGIGFVAQQAVKPIVIGGGLQLVGISPDGIALYNGGEPRMILSSWEDVIEGGVNAVALARSVCCVARQQTLAFFAIPTAGSSTNNRLLVLDYSDETNLKWWLWTAPFGVSALATQVDEVGVERLLVGTDDGFIQTLFEVDSDDGVTFTGEATSITFQPAGEIDIAPSRLNLLCQQMGGTQTLTVGLFKDRREQPETSGAYPMGLGAATFSAALWNTNLWADESHPVYRINIPSGIKGAQYRVRLAGSGRWQYVSGTMEARGLQNKVVQP